MHVWLQVASGRTPGQQFHLRGGQIARFGRSDWADFSFPDDSSMEDIQFEVRVDQYGAQLRHNGKERETLVNGDPVTETVIRNGDRVAAGDTTFAVFVEGETLDIGSKQGDEEEVAEVDPLAVTINTLKLASWLELDEEAFTHAATKQTGAEFIAKLRENQEYSSAVRVQAHYLLKPQSILWAAACLKEVAKDQLLESDVKLLVAAEKWASQGDDQDRLACGRLAEEAHYDGPAASLALGAFCSGGNIGHPDHAPVIADERITGQCVAAALVQTAYWGDPSKSMERFESFLSHELLTAKQSSPT